MVFKKKDSTRGVIERNTCSPLLQLKDLLELKYLCFLHPDDFFLSFFFLNNQHNQRDLQRLFWHSSG